MRLRLPGKTEWRLALAILLTAVVPLGAAVALASAMFRQASAIWFNPEVGDQLDQGVLVYKDYVRALKDSMRHQGDAIAENAALRDAVRKRDEKAIDAALAPFFLRYPSLVSVSVQSPAGEVIASRDRGHPVDENTERSLNVPRPLGSADDAPELVATFVVDRAALDGLERAGQTATRYHQIESSRTELYEGYVYAFAALLGMTMLVTVILGTLLARGVTVRINRLAAATELVAKGDLSVRVPVTGSDELTELARIFNRMVREMAQSRSRIEYLQRMNAWQQMAQKLAHEIKNPLTPIQLAVEECHRKYPGGDPSFQSLLDTTVEIVEEEVLTLRRLVSEFSNFARLPAAELAEEDVGEFFDECADQLSHLGVGSGDAEPDVEIVWIEPKRGCRAAIDRQLLRLAIANLVRNAAQALRESHADQDPPHGQVRIQALEDEDAIRLVVEDDGPGLAAEVERTAFDPYVTTKADGTGLGLAIVKKIAMEHGGAVEVGRSDTLGGARFVIHLPRASEDEPEKTRRARERARSAGVATDMHDALESGGSLPPWPSSPSSSASGSTLDTGKKRDGRGG